MKRRRVEAPPRGTRYYREHREAERSRKRTDRAIHASAAYAFIEVHPEFAVRWHPRYDERDFRYRLPSNEDSDFRRFIRAQGWEVGEKGRDARLRERLPPDRAPRPLAPKKTEARRRFHSEGLGRAPESFRALY